MASANAALSGISDEKDAPSECDVFLRLEALEEGCALVLSLPEPPDAALALDGARQEKEKFEPQSEHEKK
jgi:hypothetical protein